MKILDLLWLIVNLADVVGCVLSILVLRQKDPSSQANNYLYWFFVGQVIESSIATVSVAIFIVHPSAQAPVEWFVWARVSGRAIKAFSVWCFTLYMLNILSPNGRNGRDSKEVADAIKPGEKELAHSDVPIPVVDHVVADKLDGMVTRKLDDIQDAVDDKSGETNGKKKGFRKG